MHRAADKLPTSLFPKIKSVVMFGDPNLRLGVVGDKFPTGLRAKVLQVCAKGDPVSLTIMLSKGGKQTKLTMECRSVTLGLVSSIT
jgi:hypothetical protein